MRCLDTRSRSKRRFTEIVRNALPLVLGLAAWLTLEPAWADSPVRSHVGSGLGEIHFSSPAVQQPVAALRDLPRQGGYDSPAHATDADHPRADLYTLAKLAVDELEFLAGIRILWGQTEKRVERLAVKFKLKGDFSLGATADEAGPVAPDAPVMSIHPLTRRPASPPSGLSLRAIFLPSKIRWNFGFDPNEQVLFGTLKWGPYLELQSDMGAHQEVKMVFQYAF